MLNHTLYIYFLNSSHHNEYELVSHDGLICIFLMISDVSTCFHVFTGHLYIFLGEMSIQNFDYFFFSTLFVGCCMQLLFLTELVVAG